MLILGTYSYVSKISPFTKEEKIVLVSCFYCKVEFGHSDRECNVKNGRHFCSFFCKNAQRIQDEDEESAIASEWAKRAELAGMNHVVVDVPKE